MSTKVLSASGRHLAVLAVNTVNAQRSVLSDSRGGRKRHQTNPVDQFCGPVSGLTHSLCSDSARYEPSAEHGVVERQLGGKLDPLPVTGAVVPFLHPVDKTCSPDNSILRRCGFVYLRLVSRFWLLFIHLFSFRFTDCHLIQFIKS